MRHLLWYACCAATSLAIVLQAMVVCASPSLRVRARIRLELHAAHGDTGVRIQGSIRDDLDVPLARRDLQIRIESVQGLGRPQTRTLRSDGAGRFAATFAAAPDRYRVLLAFEGDAFYERAETTQSIDPERNQVSLQFVAPELREVKLDEPTTHVVVRASSAVGGHDLVIVVKDELARLVASGKTNRDGSFAFTLPSGRLGEPGLGELSAESDGDATRTAARVTKPLLRTRVTHSALQANWDAATQRLRLWVRLTTNAGPLAHKAVGIFVDRTHLITLTTNRRGEVRRQLSAPAALEPGAHDLLARFESDTPGLGSSESPSVRLEVSPPTRLSAAWLIAPAFASLAFALWSVRRAKRAEDPEEQVPKGLPEVRFGAAARGRTALYVLDGLVQDIDSGTPLPATLQLTTAGTNSVVVQAAADGRFRSATLGADAYHVRAWAPGYAPTEFDVRIPHAGTGSGIHVALRSLRAAALDAHAPVARRVFSSEAGLQVATVRDALQAAVSGARASPALARLTELVEHAAYARSTPSDDDLEQVQRAAAAALADLDGQRGISGDPSLE
jgi:hypothetical protein